MHYFEVGLCSRLNLFFFAGHMAASRALDAIASNEARHSCGPESNGSR